MTLVAVDGHHNLHRILHVPAFQEFAYEEQFTGGVYGGLVTIRSVLESFNAKQCVVVWDGKAPPFRKHLVESYKQNREPKSPEYAAEKAENRLKFSTQRKLLTNLLKLLGVRVVEYPNVEGDDLLYQVVQICTDQRIVVVSEDMDLAQLVSDNVDLWLPRKEVLVTKDNFEEHVGVTRDRFILKKALVGDTSDNIAGIKGVGDKRATSALSEFNGSGDLDEFRTFCSKHKSVPIRRIAEQFPTVARNIMVMDLARFPWASNQVQEVRHLLAKQPAFCEEEVRRIFQQLQFSSLLEHFSAWVQPFKMLGR